MRRGKEQAEGRLVQFDADRPAVEAAKRDARRFEALYRKYVAQVYSFALYETRDHHSAQDVTSLVFLRALSGLHGFREQAQPPDSSFRVWLFQIARNTLSNERRRERRHPEAPLDLAAHFPAKQDVEQTAVSRDELVRAWQVIEELPPDRRRALVLRFVEEMSAAEIGAVLGRSEGAVRVLIHRAVRSVAQHLGHRSD
ncbi:MAG TPA: RNA polymerase sigma factor [Candidatus Limnocylindria bacterium]|nr:RNA polymerase sigma factor [Candidatus Limnocylindria bacterium]